MPALYIVSAAVLSMYACGRLTGVVVDSGESATYAVPVCGGYCIPHAMCRSEVGGRDLAEFAPRLLNQRLEGALHEAVG